MRLTTSLVATVARRRQLGPQRRMADQSGARRACERLHAWKSLHGRLLRWPSPHKGTLDHVVTRESNGEAEPGRDDQEADLAEAAVVSKPGDNRELPDV